jgi:hypothetical protein
MDLVEVVWDCSWRMTEDVRCRIENLRKTCGHRTAEARSRRVLPDEAIISASLSALAYS